MIFIKKIVLFFAFRITQFMDQPTDDRPFDRRTDTPSYKDGWTHLKIKKTITVNIRKGKSCEDKKNKKIFSQKKIKKSLKHLKGPRKPSIITLKTVSSGKKNPKSKEIKKDFVQDFLNCFVYITNSLHFLVSYNSLYLPSLRTDCFGSL